jgi:hypothetical protein
VNPYAPPEAHDRPGVHDDRDGADLFIDSLAPPIVKGAALAWFSLGVFTTLFFLHIVTDLRQTPFVIVLGVVHFLLVLSCVGVGVGLLRGRSAAVWVGLGATPFLVLAAGFALFTGALAGLMALGLVLLAPALSAVGRKAVVKMGLARRLMAAAKEREVTGPTT